MNVASFAIISLIREPLVGVYNLNLSLIYGIVLSNFRKDFNDGTKILL